MKLIFKIAAGITISVVTLFLLYIGFLLIIALIAPPNEKEKAIKDKTEELTLKQLELLEELQKDLVKDIQEEKEEQEVE